MQTWGKWIDQKQNRPGGHERGCSAVEPHVQYESRLGPLIFVCRGTDGISEHWDCSRSYAS